MKQGNSHKVYLYVNKENGKRYVGVTCRTLCARASRGKGYRECTHFWRAIEKHGWDSFEPHLMRDNLSKAQADDLEKWLIRHFKTCDSRYGYNIQKGGRSAGGISREALSRVVAAHSGANAHNARSVVLFGLDGNKIARFDTCSDAARFLKCSSGLVTRACSFENSTIMGYIPFYEDDIMDYETLPISMLCKPHDRSYQNRSVCQYSLDGAFLKRYSSMTEASEHSGCNVSDICSCISGAQKSASGFMWRYDCGDYSDIPPCVREKSNKRIAQIDSKSGEVLNVFKSAKDAARAISVNYSAICRCANGRSKTSGGYSWKYCE